MTLRTLQKKIIEFRDVRNWKQFHNPKDLALSIVLEASEILEFFQWQNAKEVKKYVKLNKEKIGEELADVFKYLLIMGDVLGIDLEKATIEKMKKDGAKYPISQIKGQHTNKYSTKKEN